MEWMVNLWETWRVTSLALPSRRHTNGYIRTVGGDIVPKIYHCTTQKARLEAIDARSLNLR